MSKFTKEMVDDLANKLLIGLTPDENKMVLDEFDIIDQNIDLINEIPNITSVEPQSFALDEFYATFDSDTIEKSVPIDELLQNCDNYDEREITVPKVVE